eukprot:scaffold997_cov418-Prasinococcus_capsulatus_cf.AAC.6
MLQARLGPTRQDGCAHSSEKAPSNLLGGARCAAAPSAAVAAGRGPRRSQAPGRIGRGDGRQQQPQQQPPAARAARARLLDGPPPPKGLVEPGKGSARPIDRSIESRCTLAAPGHQPTRTRYYLGSPTSGVVPPMGATPRSRFHRWDHFTGGTTLRRQ